MQRFEIKRIRLPTCALGVVGAIGAPLTAVLVILGAALFLVVFPFILLAAAADQLKARRDTMTSPDRWPDSAPRPHRNSTPLIIDGEYQVIDEGAHKTNGTR
jgi:hypothetical protein